MKVKYSILSIFICSIIASCCDGQINETFSSGCRQIELKEDILKAVDQYIGTVNAGKTPENIFKVFRLLVEQKGYEVSFRIYPIIYYSHLVNDPPSAYLKFKNSLILISTGVEKISVNDQRFSEEIKKVVGNSLENDLAVDRKTVDPNFRHRTHNPEVWKIMFGDSLIIDKEAEQPVRVNFISK